MNNKENILQLICSQKLLPLYYNDSSEVSIAVLKTLFNAGIRIVEYTNRGANSLDNFVAMRKVVHEEMPGMYLGIGTIKSVTEAEMFIHVGADFIISPIINKDVADFVHSKGLVWIPGCLTPTEIYAAETSGAALVKIFPGSAVGPSYIAAIKELFPELLFMPTGGVDLGEKNIEAWFNAGACAVGMGSKLISKKNMDNKDYPKIGVLVKEAMNIISEIK
jgi:2-dehydro-3-deoxyphosphogluconate aldolase/(4S)-4-hydroxy-2-oxoglutarate aldolase